MIARALAAALAALALAPATAAAHATLEETVPERGARLDAAPGQVVLRFSEPVEAAFGAVRVFDADGREIQAGEGSVRGGEVAVALPPDLADGGYTVTYRVISADAHPVAGGFVFTVGEGGAAAAPVADLLDTGGAGPVTGTAFAAVRAVQYGSIAAGLGGLIFALACWLPALRAVAGAGAGWRAASSAFAGRLRALLLGAATAGALSAAAAVVLQGAVAGGTSVWEAARPDVVGEVLGTRFGLVWGLGALAWPAVAAVVLARPRALPALRPASVGATGLALPGGAGLLPLALPLAALATLPALGGHASVQAPVALLLPANLVHVAAVSAWLGGIAALVVVLRAATARLEPDERSRLLAAVVGRFSALAGTAVALLLASGAVQGVVEVRTPANLVETAFGRAVLVKIAVLAGLVALGWVNRRRLLPALRRAAGGGESPGRTGRLLRRTLRAELALGVAALAATGALAGYAPSIAEGTGPFSTTARLGPARMEATVDAGQIHLYLFDRRDGGQYDATKELTVTAALPEKGIEPIELEAAKAGPGHYVVAGAALRIPGDWVVEIAARVSAFDEHRTRFEVPVQ